MPHDLSLWHAVYAQTRRWLDAAVLEAIVTDLRVLIRTGKVARPTQVP